MVLLYQEPALPTALLKLSILVGDLSSSVVVAVSVSDEAGPRSSPRSSLRSGRGLRGLLVGLLRGLLLGLRGHSGLRPPRGVVACGLGEVARGDRGKRGDAEGVTGDLSSADGACVASTAALRVL